MTQDISRLSHCISPLLYWYSANKRSLPWRDDPTPYKVWISEIMLQQTRVEAVKPYFERFLSQCPTVFDLASIEDGRLMKLWEGLGYYARARNLKKAAQIIVKQYGGHLPSDYDSLLSLPGIGPYTAGAICSIAHGLPTPAVDGNVLRVTSRILAMDGDITKDSVKKEITKALSAVYPTEPAECACLTQAWMELGATVCIPVGKPECERCPLAHLCYAHLSGEETAYPIKPAKKGRRIEKKTVLLLRYHGKYAICRRNGKGLLEGLYEFPNLDGHKTEEEITALFGSEKITPLPVARHIFTHIEWEMIGYLIDLDAPTDHIYTTPKEIAQTYAVASAFSAYHKIITGVDQQ